MVLQRLLQAADLSPQSPVRTVLFSETLQTPMWTFEFSKVSLRRQALGLGGLAGRVLGFLGQFGQDFHASCCDKDCVLELRGPETHGAAVRTRCALAALGAAEQPP